MGWVSGLLLLWVGTIPHQVPCLVAVEIGSPHYSTSLQLHWVLPLLVSLPPCTIFAELAVPCSFYEEVKIRKLKVLTLVKHMPRLLLGILNAHRKIRKCTDTDVAFTRGVFQSIDFYGEHEVC